MSNLTSVISKVQKLLALSKSSNENESKAALNAANKIIDEFRLTSEDLSYTAEDEIAFDEGYVYETSKVTAWKQSLLHVLAKHFGCALLNEAWKPEGRLVSRFKLVGRKGDMEIARYFYGYLTSECSRLAQANVKGTGRVAIASYCLGFVNGVGAQLAESRKAVVAETHSTGLVKLEARAELSKKFMHDSIKNLKTVKSRSAAQFDMNAYHSGKQAGERMHLGTSLPSKTKMLGS